jgi:hypothetical protein
MSESDCPLPVIALLTDFGIEDGFVGVMRGVIAGIAPKAVVIDHSHAVPPQDIRAASFLLSSSAKYFPPRTIHVAVVDPGVGSKRRGLALESGGRLFVGPDNGIFTSFLDGARIHSLENPEYWLPQVSHTFHGRDIFAPVAAHLANSCPLERLGPEIFDPIRLELLKANATSDGWQGRLVYIDRFGNLVTSFTEENVSNLAAGGPLEVRLEDGSVWPVCKTYSEVPAYGPCAVMGGFGTLELSINLGHAAEKTGALAGWKALLRIKSD